MTRRDVTTILSRARGASPPPEWMVRSYPRVPFEFPAGGVFSFLIYLLIGFLAGYAIMSVVAILVGIVWQLAGWSEATSGPVAKHLAIAYFGGCVAAGIGVLVQGNICHHLLVITNDEAVMATYGPMRLWRRTRVLRFAQFRGMDVQYIHHWGDREYTTHRLVLRRAHGRSQREKTWNIHVGAELYQEIVDHFERTHPNDKDGLTTVQRIEIRLMDD